MKDKYNDTKLAEEFDLIILTKDAGGMKKGDIGTLVYSYTGESRPLCVQFLDGDEKPFEREIYFNDFRVLNIRDKNDLPLIVDYMKNHRSVAV